MRAPFLLVLIASSALAYEQPLAFTVTGPNVEQGKNELFVSVLPRFGRPSEYLRIENLIGVGYGFTRTVEAQLLIAVAIESFGRDGKAIEGGAQARVRWNPLDSRTRFLGVNVLGAVGLGSASVYLEGRLGLEKWVGDFLFAINASVDYRFRRDGGVGPELHLEQSGGIVYRLPNNFTSGFEVRNRLGFERGTYYGDAIFAGPVFGWRYKSLWFSIAALPQVAAVKAQSQVGNGQALELRDNERVVLRLQLGFDL
jgi:hypothetical protein